VRHTAWRAAPEMGAHLRCRLRLRTSRSSSRSDRQIQKCAGHR
jgi:hypothetical protein